MCGGGGRWSSQKEGAEDRTGCGSCGLARSNTDRPGSFPSAHCWVSSKFAHFGSGVLVNPEKRGAIIGFSIETSAWGEGGTSIRLVFDNCVSYISPDDIKRTLTFYGRED